MACPASVAAEAGIPDQGSAAAADGTDQHELAKVCLLNGEVDANSYVGLPVKSVFGHPGASGTETVPEAWAAGVNRYLEYVWSKSPAHVERYVETRVSLEVFDPRIYGTADALLLDPKARTLEVVDYKSGRGYVSAEGNPQTKIYALAALLTFPSVEIDTVTTTIVQPLAASHHVATHGDGAASPVRSATYTSAELWAWLPELLAAADRTADPAAPFVPGDHCKFCKKRASCEALASFVAAEATAEFADVKSPALAGLASDALAARFLALPTIKAYVDAIEAEALSRAQAGDVPPGLKWVAGRSTRRWREDGDTIAARIVAETGIDVRETVCPSPAQAEKKLGKKLFKTLEPALVTKAVGRPRLASAADERPAITPNSDDWKISEFAPIPE
jgi:hypothetical protein